MTFDPYEPLPSLPTMQLRSPDFAEGEQLPLPQVGSKLSTGGGDATPELHWDDVPEGTKSFALTCLDPDAPTGSGFWHLAVYDIPADLRSLEAGAITFDQISPELANTQAKVLPNDRRVIGFVGSAPPPGHGPHRYMFVIHAVDTEQLDLPQDATPARLGFMLFQHAIGRGRLTGIYEQK